MYASVAQLVEQRTENPRVVGSIPIGGTIADLAHLVERDLAKVEVAGSSPVIRSKKKRTPMWVFSFFAVCEGARSRSGVEWQPKWLPDPRMTERVVRARVEPRNPLRRGENRGGSE